MQISDNIVKILSDNIVEILNFGFLGLSLLMVGLAYMLVRYAINVKIDEKTIPLVHGFMKVSIIFMALAAPLQWVTIGIKYRIEERKKYVSLQVDMFESSQFEYSKKMGEVYIIKDGSKLSIIDSKNKAIQFQNNDKISVYLDELIEYMREQIAKSTEKLTRQSEMEVLEGV